MRKSVAILVSVLLAAAVAAADTVFIEAESFAPSRDGWRVSREWPARRASRTTTLCGATGVQEATAKKAVTVEEAGAYRIWVRHIHHDRWRGPFRLRVTSGGKELGAKDFDLEPKAGVENFDYLWDYLDADLPAGEITLTLSKHENRNCAWLVRHVDCLLLTRDKQLIPDHIPYGSQTYLRVTLGDAYERPVYVHVFAHHYRKPWCAHYALSRDGTERRVAPRREEALLRNGEATPWCNITPMLYQDSGARLVISTQYAYRDIAPRLVARLEFATAPDEKSIVRTLNEDRTPGGLFVIVPPDFTTPEHKALFITDREMAERTGKRADAMKWPTVGRTPTQFPFLVRSAIGSHERLARGIEPAKEIAEREWRTLDYFGFSNKRVARINGHIWQYGYRCYSRPDTAKMTERAEQEAQLFRERGLSVDDILFCRLTDEPKGQPSSHLAECEACTEEFRKWLREQGKTPPDVLEADWDAVRPIEEARRDEHPGLHYYTQKFRTVALGRYMLTQSNILRKAYGREFTVNASFSDGAIFYANFCAQGLDYFDLLESGEQSGLFVSDWSNCASTFQCAAFNTELMRGAARVHKQHLVQYLIAYANRTPWEIKVKAAAETARGVKALVNFFYGPAWGSNEGGPYWRSTAWYCKPETWFANAEIVREIGWAEDFLVPAMPVPARTALLYSSSTDIWTYKYNYAYGFDRMNTWLALAHEQIPVDVVSERHVAEGVLDEYDVCYVSGPNLTRAAAERLKQWVTGGGTLVLTAGAGARDEFNRALGVLDEVLPAERGKLEEFQPYLSYGRGLYTLNAEDHASVGDARIEVLSVKERLSARAGGEVLGVFGDGSPALVRGTAGRGRVNVAGFLPGLAYVKGAIDHARRSAEKQRETAENAPPAGEIDPAKAFVDRPSCLWWFPAEIRGAILRPVREAGVSVPVTCSVPLVDAVCMACEKGLLIPLANYTLRKLPEVRLTVRSSRPIERVESAHCGGISFRRTASGCIEFCVPLNETDFVKCYYKGE